MPVLKQAPLLGILGGAGVWAITTQLCYSIVAANCSEAEALAPLVSAIAIGIAIAAGALSLPAWSPASDGSFLNRSLDGRPRAFVAAVSVLVAAIFVLAISLQGIASLIIDGCQR
jgi:hypothetical protein